MFLIAAVIWLLYSVQSIGDSVFARCSSLASVTIGNGIQWIKNSAFNGCTGLQSINVSEGNANYKSEDGVLFSKDGAALILYPARKTDTSYSIPDNVQTIENYAFSNCYGLTSITIGNDLQSISNVTLVGCNGLQSINASEGNANYKSEDGVLFSKDGAALILYPAGKTDTSYSIPDNVQTIESYAFSNCYGLTSITIGNGVRSIEYGAFYDCSNLTSLTYNGISEPEISDSAFDGCNIESVNVPINYIGETFCGMLVNKIGESGINTGNCGENVTYTFDGETLTISGSGAMSDYSNDSFAPWNDYKDSIKSVVIEDDVQTIGEYAFSGCSSLTSVTIGNYVEYIRNYAFSDCSSLTSVTIGSGVKYIGGYAFSGCSSLISVTYNGIFEKQIGEIDSAFFGCNITEVVIPTNYEGDTFCGMSVNKIGKPGIDTGNCGDKVKYTFDGETLTIPGSVQSIGNRAFSDCSSLTSITYNGTSEPEISDSAFEGCNIESVNVPNNYEGETFCGKPVNKTINPDKPVDPENPGKPSKPGKSKAGVIAGSVVAAVVVVAAIVVTIVMYVKKLGCFGRVMDSISAASAVSP